MRKSIAAPQARDYVLDYCRHDCTGYRNASADSESRARIVQTFERALDGDIGSLEAIFGDYDAYGSGDNECWWPIPRHILCAVGDRRYSEFVLSVSPQVRQAALSLLTWPLYKTDSPQGLNDRETLAREFPETNRLFIAYEASQKTGEAGRVDPSKQEQLHSAAQAEAKARVLKYAREYPANPSSHTVPHQNDVMKTFARAVEGDHRALERIFSDYTVFGSGDCEAWCKVPLDILRALGDDRFHAFVANQPASIRVAALKWLVGPFGFTADELGRDFPKTSKLYKDAYSGSSAKRSS